MSKRILKKYEFISDNTDFVFSYILNDTGLDILDHIGVGKKYKVRISENEKLSHTKDYVTSRDPDSYIADGYFFDSLFSGLLRSKVPFEIREIEKSKERKEATRKYRLDTTTIPIFINYKKLHSIVLQALHAKMFLWEMKEKDDFKFNIPCSICYTDELDMYRLEPGGTRLIFNNFNQLCTHDVIETVRDDVYRKYPEELLIDKVSTLYEIKKYIQNLIDNGKKVSITKYRTRVNPETGLYENSGFLQIKVENDDTNKYAVDMDTIRRMKIFYKNRVLGLSDGTELLKIHDDYSVEIIESKKRPWYWKEK